MSEFFNPANFCNKPCVVSYNGVVLGGTDGAVTLSREDETREISCNQSGGDAVQKITTMIKVTVSARFKEINKALEVLLEDNRISSDEIGNDLLADSCKHTLVLSEIGEGGRVITVNQAVVNRSFSYDIDGENDHGIEITFEASVNTASDSGLDILTVK